MKRPQPAMALGLLVLLLALAGADGRAEDPPQAATPGAREALADLASPFERTRRAAVRRLVEGLPDTRAAVLAALPRADPTRKALLVEVLAADGSPAAIRALLAVMEEGDAALAVRIRTALVASEEATRRVLEAWTENPSLREDGSGRVSRRTRDLERLLRRAETERLFVSRKSRSGSTGSYHGQYDVLRPYRKETIELCVGVLTDRAVPVPGVYTAGRFAFVRPLTVHVDSYELQGMAAHAFSELGRADDVGALAILERRLDELEVRWQAERWGNDIVFRDLLGQYGDLLVSLYLVQPAAFSMRLEDFLLAARRDSRLQTELGTTWIAVVMLRIGRFEEAVQRLEGALYGRDAQGEASANYNLACAYAQWGANTEEPRLRRFRLQRALFHLRRAVESQWLDIGWMEEDRDLEPIRDTDEYRELAARVRAELGLGDD